MADEQKERPLSDEELRQVRALIEKDKRVLWLWTSLRTYAMWISAVVLGGGVALDFFKRIVKSLAGP